MSNSEIKDTAHYICNDSDPKVRANRRADLCAALAQNRGNILTAFYTVFGLDEIANTCTGTANKNQPQIAA